MRTTTTNSKTRPPHFVVRWFGHHRRLVLAGIGLPVAVAVGIVVFLPSVEQTVVQNQLYNGQLQDADYWNTTPQILSAGLGFTNIIGLPSLDEQTVRAAGGAWDINLVCGNGTTPDATQRTSAALSSGIPLGYKVSPGATIDHEDGLPIVFSWPVRTDTIDPADFQFTLNTGQVIFPNAAGILPNWELNERNVVVVFGHLGNRGLPGEPGAEYPVRLTVVAGHAPLTLVGPDREQSAVGMTWTTDHSGYAVGPTLVGAKLNRVSNPSKGEGGVAFLGNNYLPNDEVSLYGSAANFRLRMLTSGGFSPDGVHGLLLTDFEKYFRLRAIRPDGTPMILDKTGVDYQVLGGRLRILGLSDVGKKVDVSHGVVYDQCYNEDRDNYIDVILSGDAEAARNITYLEMPGLPAGYGALYNPGGPGPTPFAGVRYTAPSPPVLEPVTIALDNPMRVSRP